MDKKNNKLRRTILVIFLLVISSSIICVTYMYRSALPAKPTQIPEISPVAVLGLPSVQEWDNTVVESLCIIEQINYSDGLEPNFASDFMEILESMNFQVKTASGFCDANLTIEMNGEPLEEFYSYLSEPTACYSGADYQGHVVLSSQNQTTLTYPINVRLKPPEAIDAEECEHFPEDAPFGKAYDLVILEVVEQIWGPAGLVSMLDRGNVWGLSDRILGHGAQAVPALTQLLVNEDRELGDEARRLLEDLGAQAQGAVPVMVQILVYGSSGDSAFRGNIATTLGQIGAQEGVVPGLIAALSDKSPQVRTHAAMALGDIGPSAQEAVPALTVMCEKENSKVACDAIRSINYGNR